MKQWLSKKLVNWLLPGIDRKIQSSIITEIKPALLSVAELENRVAAAQKRIKNLENSMAVLLSIISSDTANEKIPEET
jgi:uncharacterized small protein (DUF1192 family)